MKLSKLILLVGIVFYTTQTYSQQIANTTWQINNFGGSIAGYYHFSIDSVYGSPNNMNYNAIGTFQEIGNQFKIVESALQPCQRDTGEYTFTIINNTLNFTLSQDPCTFRSTLYANVTWSRVITTGIDSRANRKISTPVYPNPTDGLITIPFIEGLDGVSFYVMNQIGKTVLRGEFSSQKQTLDLIHLSKGVYHLKAEDGQIETQRIIKL